MTLVFSPRERTGASMIVIPAIDIMNGCCVRLVRGDYGTAYKVAKDAVKKVMRIQKKEFFDNQLADMFRSMELLSISIEEITERYNKLKKDGS